MESANRKTIALDSNVLILAVRERLDVFSLAREKFGNVEFVVPEQVLSELSLLAKKSAKMARELNVVKKMLESNNCRAVHVEAENADDALFGLSRGRHALVFSGDRELGKRIKNDNGAIIYLRRKRLLETFGLE